MLAEDLLPSRLDRARQFIGKLMNAMPDDRIALVLFAGKAYLQMPLTVDHAAARMFVSSASPDAVPQQGTVISDALNMSSNVFDNADLRYKSVVLISDGEDHDEAAIETARSLKGRGIMINTVGVGSTEGTTFTDPSTGDLKKDESGSPVVSRLNETTLQAVAAETNGVYVLLNSSDQAVSEIKAQLSQIETRSYSDLSQVEFRNYFPWLAAAALLLLLVEFFVPETKRLKR
jgi:Ca-activated chloride channel family protein